MAEQDRMVVCVSYFFIRLIATCLQRTRLRVVAACTLERESAALGGCVRRHLVGYAGRAAITRRRWYPSTPWTWTSYRWLVHPISRKGPARFYRQSQRMKDGTCGDGRPLLPCGHATCLTPSVPQAILHIYSASC
jgi:hypothetical protein